MRNLTTELIAAKNYAAYDEAVKGILASKDVLAWILKWTTTEYSALTTNEITKLIEDPSVSNIPVNPGLTNDRDSKITGLPTESNIQNESVIHYDVRFFVRNPLTNGRTNTRIIVNVEAQSDPNPGYDLVTRGVFYCGRMLSEQAGRNFKGSDYDSIDKVYSIWICFNCSTRMANTTSRYIIGHESLYGLFKDDSRHDLMQVIMVRLPSEDNYYNTLNRPTEFHQMLFDLFVKKMDPSEKIAFLRETYGFDLSEQEGGINKMSNLAEGVFKRGVNEGVRQIVESMLKKGKTPEEIHDLCDIPLEKIKEIQEESLQLV